MFGFGQKSRITHRTFLQMVHDRHMHIFECYLATTSMDPHFIRQSVLSYPKAVINLIANSLRKIVYHHIYLGILFILRITGGKDQ